MNTDFLLDRFTLGLGLGLIFAGFAWWKVFSLKLELRRFKLHLSDRLEIEADHHKRGKADLEGLKKENEQLRIRISEYNFAPEWKAHRELEIYARAEKRMLINAPGFAPAWETAKSAAHGEMREEEAGRSLPKRVFSRFFGAKPPIAVRDTSSPTDAGSENS